MSNVVLEIKNLTRRFGALTAVDALTLSAAAGEVFSLLGSNLLIFAKLNDVPRRERRGRDYVVILLTTIILVFAGARLYPRLAS